MADYQLYENGGRSKLDTIRIDTNKLAAITIKANDEIRINHPDLYKKYTNSFNPLKSQRDWLRDFTDIDK